MFTRLLNQHKHYITLEKGKGIIVQLRTEEQ